MQWDFRCSTVCATWTTTTSPTAGVSQRCAHTVLYHTYGTVWYCVVLYGLYYSYSSVYYSPRFNASIFITTTTLPFAFLSTTLLPILPSLPPLPPLPLLPPLLPLPLPPLPRLLPPPPPPPLPPLPPPPPLPSLPLLLLSSPILSI